MDLGINITAIGLVLINLGLYLNDVISQGTYTFILILLMILYIISVTKTRKGE